MGTATSKLYKTPHSERGGRAFRVEKARYNFQDKDGQNKTGMPKRKRRRPKPSPHHESYF